MLLLTLALLGGCAGNRSSSRNTDDSGTSPPVVGPLRFTQPDLPPPNDLRTADGRPGPAYWQNQADYTIDATLDEPARAIAGHEFIHYINRSPLPLDHLWIHLDQNLYRPDSQAAALTKATARFAALRFDGGLTLGEVRVNGRPAPVHIYDTLARIDLPQGVALPSSGGAVDVECSWTFKIPGHGSDRMGIFEARDGPVFQIAQWFPQVVKYDDARAWNTLPYLGQGEFYTDFGDYTVALTVPRSHLVAATGELANPEEVLTRAQLDRLDSARSSEATLPIRTIDEITDPASRPGAQAPTTWRFRAPRVRTFAWASSAAFAWDACAAKSPGIGRLGPSPGSVLCQALYPREAAPLWTADGQGGGAAQALRFCIEHYSARWFPFPYAAASNVNGTVGGMEYPGLIFCENREDDHNLFGVTSHEIGHTWFPMVVNSDERRHAWMDEGFNTFINHFAYIARYGKPRDTGDPRRRLLPRVFAEASRDLTGQPIETPADLIMSKSLGRLEYTKTAIGLLTLREVVLGPERFDTAFREYIHRWAFHSPRPADFFRSIEDSAGMDLGWFWREWFFGTGLLDQAVTTVMQPEGDGRDARITFRNLGALIMPVPFRVEYTDGTTEDRTLPVEAWANADEYQASFDTRTRQIRRILIDPNDRLPDIDGSNNIWSR